MILYIFTFFDLWSPGELRWIPWVRFVFHWNPKPYHQSLFLSRVRVLSTILLTPKICSDFLLIAESSRYYFAWNSILLSKCTISFLLYISFVNLSRVNWQSFSFHLSSLFLILIISWNCQSAGCSFIWNAFPSILKSPKPHNPQLLYYFFFIKFL